MISVIFGYFQYAKLGNMELLDTYMDRITEIIKKGDAREETFYPALETLIKSVAEQLNQPKADLTILPKPTEAGNPDFRVWDGSHSITGYIEAKLPGENLDNIAETEQLQRYRSTFPNVILTDFFEFRLYKDGDLVDKVNIGRPFVATKLGEKPPLENVEEFLQLIELFFSHSVPRSLRASSLAKELAKRTRFLEHIIEKELIQEKNRNLTGFYKAFQQHLIAGLSKNEFADLYAQTVAYGLFAARTRANETFTRRNAVEFIPSTIGILKEVFQFISYGQLPENIRWIVDDIAEILNAADINNILKRYFDEGKGADPIIHFYETFLSEYNPELRERRGVYYTPEPVVGYIVRSVHQVLKEDFGKPMGLADNSVTVLDPAAGTLTFIAEAIKVAVNEYVETYGEGGVNELIKDHLLEHFYAFELMMAPYAIGHLKMGFILEELGYAMQDDERFQLYLTNTLEMEDLEQTELPGMASLSDESKAAGKIKKEEPVLVILGNPPYSGHSANNSPWIDELLKQGYKTNGHEDDGYYTVDGEPLGERNPKWLQDDYVKFIRFAQWKMDQNGSGIVGVITNHSYLDNPTFRGMRESLMNSFDEIRLLDLHGNTLKKETAPDGSKDENVFDIRAGVSIALMKKKNGNTHRVYRGDLYGRRNEKYSWLESHQAGNTSWEEIKPQRPFYFYKKQDYDLNKIYQTYISVNDLFPVNSVGIVTSRDPFVIDFEREKLIQRINTFRNRRYTDEQVSQLLELKSTGTWNLSEARKQFQAVENWKDYVTEILYRPFDKRKILYHHLLIERDRGEVMQHMIKNDNLSLCTMRQVSLNEDYTHALISENIVDNRTFLSSKGIIQQAPLYLYNENNRNTAKNKKGYGTMMMVFEEEVEYDDKKPNINKEFYVLLEKTYKFRPTPEQILHYTYAVLFAPAYRQTYAEFLKSDFPRIPFTKNSEMFEELAELGRELADLHLMNAPALHQPVAKFQGRGSNVVAKTKSTGRNYKADEQRVYINEEMQYFEGIPEGVWEYQIGGYQVLDKWLYDRRERHLSNDEIQHYCRVVTALAHTINMQSQIDEIYEGVEKEVIQWE